MSEHRNIGGWPKRIGLRYPGEPLYNLDELAARLGIDAKKLNGLIRHHPGLEPWKRTVGTGLGSQRHVYRFSDAKRWWDGLSKDEQST